MPKIKVKNPIVELGSDETARIIESLIKTKLIQPDLGVNLK